MIRLLAFSFYPAFMPTTSGGESRLFNFYKALSRRYHITLLSSTYHDVEEDVIYHDVNFVERRIPKDEYFCREYAALEEHSGGGDLSGPGVAAMGKFPTYFHRAYLEEYGKADALIFDAPFFAEVDLFAGLDDKPRIYNAYNCETFLYKQLHPSDRSHPIHEVVENAERLTLETADLVLYCNDSDLSAFWDMVPTAKFDAIFAPNGMTPISTNECVSSSNDKVFHAVFMGSGHLPNVVAVEFITRVLAPSMPEVIFDIIGNCLPEGEYAPNIKRHGVVDHTIKRQLLECANIALNPMATGSGSNLKVLDYFSSGLPVLSTPFGMRGIQAMPGEEYLEATLDQFISVLQQATVDPALLCSIGEAGRSLAMKRYTWEAIAEPVADRIDTLVKAKADVDKKRFVLALNDYDSFADCGGGGTRTRGLYEAVREWTPVVLVSFSSEGKLQARLHDADIVVINVPKTIEHVADQERVNAQFHVSADDIIASRHCSANPWLQAIYEVLRQSARCIVAEHCYLAGLPISYGDRFVYSSHNNETELKKILLEWHPLKTELLPEVESIERLAVECSAATIAVSLDDAESLLRGKRTAGPMIVVRNGASTPAVGEEVKRAKHLLRERIGNRAAVFLGSAHIPNVDAAKYITEQLAHQCPNVQFHLLGSVCSAISNAPTNVRLWGIVGEVTKSAVMQSCDLALNPMGSGGGSNVKMADYLANGLFVVSTEFGVRGYPSSVFEHVSVAPLNEFAETIQESWGNSGLFTQKAKTSRMNLFEQELSMQVIAQGFVKTLQGLEQQKKRLLFVTYRYTNPLLGGAESHVEKFIRAVGNSGDFDVDVVAPEISGIHNHQRFSEHYDFDMTLGAPVDIPNVRFARFPIDTPSQEQINTQLRKAWSAQPSFEMVIDRSLREYYQENGLTWGWFSPEGEGSQSGRWTSIECGIFLHKPAKIDLECFAVIGVVMSVYSGNRLIWGPWTINGNHSLSFYAEAGEVRLSTSAPPLLNEPRPLGIWVSKVVVDTQSLDLIAPTLLQRCLLLLPAEKIFRLFDQAAMESRNAQGVRLTDCRGPWSTSLERFIADHVSDYDLVVTHNNVFRPAVIAIEEANKHGVPSILIPHAHLDDDFYHFPDLIESAQNASLVLAVPKAACDFFEAKGCSVAYLPAGCDASERFTSQDRVTFRQVHASIRPFILVLGRKTGAKGYQQIIGAIEQLNQEGTDLQVVMIGPDDDGILIESPNAVYLGLQPRSVVRGALLSCYALCNMSSSESFGIVLLEAWLASKPVIANKHCAAFHDICNDSNSILVGDGGELKFAIKKLAEDPRLGTKLGEIGKLTALKFDWSVVNNNFLEHCLILAKKRKTYES